MSRQKVLLLTAIALLTAPCWALGNALVSDSYHDDHRATPRLMFDPLIQPEPAFSAQETALNYLRDSAPLFRLPADLSNLKMTEIQESLLGWHVRFRQEIDGIPVEGGEIIVSILFKDRRVYMVYNNTFPVVYPVRKLKSLIGAESALDIAWSHLKVHGKLLGIPTAKLAYVPEGPDFVLVYKTLVSTEAPFGYWEHHIDAASGEIRTFHPTEINWKSNLPERLEALARYDGPVVSRLEAQAQYSELPVQAVQQAPNAALASGTGKVFDPDPKSTLNSDALLDTSPAASFTAAYFTRTLQDITLSGGTYSLVGPYVQISNFESPNTAPSTTADGNWTAERGNNAFNDAMTYFHIDQSQRHLRAMGFLTIQNNSIQTDSDGLSGDDNSHYIPSTNQLAFGHGGVDDNEDADVILHEYWHAIQHSINSSWGGADTGAMGEGFGDYWGASYGYTFPNGPTFHPAWAFHWDGHTTGMWGGRFMDLMTAQYDPTKSYPAHTEVNGINGDELWGTPVMQAFLTLAAAPYSRPRDDMDKIVVQSNFGLGSSLKMPDMANAMVATCNSLFPGGPHAQIYINNFVRHNILTTPHATITLDTTTLVGESCAPANNAPDPGETVSFDIALKNTGTANTSNLVATLQASGGVTSPSGAQTYGALTFGGAAVVRNFSFTVSAAKACGDNIVMTLRLMDGTNDLGTLTITKSLGQLVSAGSFSSGAVSVAIPDNSATGVTVPVTVTGAGTVGKVVAKVRLNHTYDGDVTLSLIGPDNTTVVLSNRRGSSGDNYGSGSTNCSGTYCVFDDAAATAVASGAAPFAGSYIPDNPLSAFAGKTKAGTWQLKAVDSAGSDTGTVYCVTLDFSEAVCCDGSTPCTITSCDATATPSSGIAPLAVNFSGSVVTDCTGTPTYSWNYGDGSGTGSGQAPSHTYTTPGTYNWTMTVGVDGHTCQKTGTVTATAGTVTIQAAGSTITSEECTPANGASDPGEMVTYSLSLQNTGTAGTTNLVGALQTGNGVTLPSATQNYGALAAGGSAVSRSFTFTVDPNRSCGSVITATLVLTDGATPCGSVAFPITLGQNVGGSYQCCTFPCAIVSCSATASSTGGLMPVPVNFSASVVTEHCTGTPAFAWDYGDGATGSGQSVSHTYSTAGVFTWTMTVTVEGQTCQKTGTVTVSDCVPPTISQHPQSQTICAGETVTFTTAATGTGPLHYQWYKGTTQVGSDAPNYTTPPLSSTPTAGYTVRVTNGCGDQTSNAAIVTVKQPAHIDGASWDQTVCSGQKATLNLAVSGATPITIRWYESPNGTDFTEIPLASGPTYTTPNLTAMRVYKATTTNACGSDTKTMTVELETAPVIEEVVLSSETVNTGHTAELTATYHGDEPIFFQWYEGESGNTAKPLEGEIEPHLVTPPLYADSSFWVRATNACGHFDSQTIPVAVWNVYYLPHVAVSDLWWSNVSMVNAEGLVKTDGEADVDVTFRAYDQAGSLLETKTFILPSLGRYSQQVRDIFAPTTLGQDIWMTVESKANLKGLVEFGTTDNAAQANLPFLEEPTHHAVFPYVVGILNWYTGITLVNTQNQAATATLSAFDEAGTELAATTVAIPPKGKYVRLISGIFPPEVELTTIRSLSVDADQPLVGFELFGTLGDPGLAGLPMVKTGEPSSMEIVSLHYPEVPANTEWYTGVTFSNLDVRQALVFAEAFDQTGAPLGTEIMLLNPHQQITREVWDLFPMPQYENMSYFLLEALERISGFELVLSRPAPFRFDGLPAIDKAHQNQVFPVCPTGPEATTSIRLINGNDVAATLSVMAYDNAGILLGTYPLALQPKAKISLDLAAIFPAVAANIAWLQVEGDNGFIAHAFILSTDNQRLITYLGMPID